jgi:hypothetical protein
MRRHFQGRGVLYAAIGSAMTLAVGIAHSTSETSEIDSYAAAVKSQSKVDALNFIRDFRSSHLVGDLIESLRPEVAEQVCLELKDGGPARAREACEALHAGFAVQPDVQTAGTAPAAGIAETVNPLPLGADTSAGALLGDDETAATQEPSEAKQADMSDPGSIDRSVISAPSDPAVEPVSASASKSASAPSNASDADLFYLPVATAAAVSADKATAPASTATVIGTESTPETEDLRGGQGNGDTNKSDGANTFLQIPRRVHISPSPSVSLVPLSAPASIGMSSGNSPFQSGGAQNTGETSGIQSSDTSSSSDETSSDQSDNGQTGQGKKGSAQTSNDLSSGDQGSSDQNSSSAHSSSSAEISSDQSDNGQKGKGKKGSAQTSNDKSSSNQSSSSAHSDSSADISSDQNGDGKEGKGKGSKDKGDKDKGGKKGDKDKGGE